MIVGISGQGIVRPQEDWPRCTTGREDHRIRLMAVTHRTPSVVEIRAAVGTPMTQRTVRNQLLQGQLRARHTVPCISLTPNHCRFQRQ
ncbi:uncharacterized protein TNCV_2802251 [Trichonephila clavipes]|nr:uncharacterized protein TNCV_2802251 [Trichonephila clavipes]